MQVLEHIFVRGEVYHKVFMLDEGEAITKHRHNLDHTTLLVKGCVMLTVDGENEIHYAPDHIFIEAGKRHGMQAVNGPATLYCTHITDCTDPDTVDHTLVMEGEDA
jgi:quercetin dioxygenase-like cupin family protein